MSAKRAALAAWQWMSQRQVWAVLDEPSREVSADAAFSPIAAVSPTFIEAALCMYVS